ncbi:dTDP-4-amino-4,6-dideoxygalactose transaminase [compost metagenome]
MYYLKLRGLQQRSAFIESLKAQGVMAVFHYVPLHSSPCGTQWGEFKGDDAFTTSESERLVRLPIWYGMDEATQDAVIDSVRHALKAA